MGLVENSQDVLRSAQERLTSQTSMENTIARRKLHRAEADRFDAEHDAAIARQEASEALEEAARQILALQKKLSQAEETLFQKDILIEAGRQMIEERDKILDSWVIEQTAFKNLLRKFGKMPDGTAIVDLPVDERIRLVQEERAAVEAHRARKKEGM